MYFEMQMKALVYSWIGSISYLLSRYFWLKKGKSKKEDELSNADIWHEGAGRILYAAATGPPPSSLKLNTLLPLKPT